MRNEFSFDFLACLRTLTLGSSVLLPGTGLAASCGLLNAETLKPLEPIWEAAVSGRWNIVREWLSLDPSLINVTGDATIRNCHFHELSLLHLATAKNPSVNILKYLVSQGADVNAKSKCGWTPLFLSAYSAKDVEFVKYLISQGADIHAKDNSGRTPLHCAVSMSNTNIKSAQFLASQGADVNARDCEGKTPLLCLFLIGRDDRVEIIKLLVSYGADVNAIAEKGLTPLLHMIQGCHLKEDNRGHENVEAVEYLISVGADVNAISESGRTPLDFAEFLHRNEIMECLIRHGGVALNSY